jgi:hypothetical protein
MFSILISLIEDFDVYISTIRAELKKRYALLSKWL